MEDCKPVDTPMNLGTKLSKEMAPKSTEEVEERNLIPDQQVIGSIMCPMRGTRPDLAHSLGVVSQYLMAFVAQNLK